MTTGRCWPKHPKLNGLASRYVLPGDLKAEYGRDLTSYMIFARMKLM